jgi:hypothetical protein
MARTWPGALRYVHLPSSQAGPGRDDEIGPDGPYPDSAAMWTAVAPYIHGYLLQDTWVFTGEHVEAGRTRDEQFVYDLLDKSRRFRYGAAHHAPRSGAEVERWNRVRGADGKAFWQWTGSYPTRGAADGPLDIVAFEYASYVIKRHPERYAEAKEWGARALTVPGIAGFGDSGPR